MDGPGWWAYIYPKNLNQFEQPKVMLPDYNDAPAAALDHAGRFYCVTGYCLTLKRDSPISLSSLTCLLNSRLLFWLLGRVGTALQRGFVRFMPQYLDQLPIPSLSNADMRGLKDVATNGSRSGYLAVAAALNAVVYRYYGLNANEIAIVDGKFEIRDQ
jgi:hypothetical protein